MELNIETLRDIVGDYDYQLCTQARNEIAEMCIERAKVFVKSIYIKANRLQEYDESLDNVSDAIMQRAAFELLVKGKMFNDANQKRTEVQAMLTNLLGSAADTYNDDNLKKVSRETVVVVKRGQSANLNIKNY